MWEDHHWFSVYQQLSFFAWLANASSPTHPHTSCTEYSRWILFTTQNDIHHRFHYDVAAAVYTVTHSANLRCESLVTICQENYSFKVRQQNCCDRVSQDIHLLRFTKGKNFFFFATVWFRNKTLWFGFHCVASLTSVNTTTLPMSS